MPATMPDLATYVLMLIPLAIAGGLIWLYLKKVDGQKGVKDRIAYHGVAKKDWVATGRIDFATREDASSADADQPAEFKLLVEERRIVESIAGNENLEIQWRLATLKEAKVVTAHYHKYVADHSLIKSVFDEQAAPDAAPAAAPAAAPTAAPTSAPAAEADTASKPQTESVVRVVASNKP
jgi:hypothetical protein